MAILGPEGVHQIARISPVHLEMRQIYVEAPVARHLGLHDGQVVQAVAALRQDQLKLVLNEHVFNLPLSPYIKEGDMVQLRAQLLPTGQWALQLLHSGSFAGHDPLTPAAAPSRLNTLLFQPEGFANWLNLLRPGVLEAMLPAGESQSLLERFLGQRLSMASLQGATLKRWVLKHTKSGEANLAEGVPLDDDPKALLRLLMNARATEESQEASANQETLQHALDELEGSQLKALQDLHKGDLNFSMVIPFSDADPIELQFERQGNKPGQPKNPLVVNIHTVSQSLGEVWLKTTIRQDAQVDLTMWALKPEVASLARFNASELTYELEFAGLVMGSFQVFNARRPDSKPQREAVNHGALVDTRV
jgi:hypothetical protein